MKINHRIFIAALGLGLGILALILIYVVLGNRVDTSVIDYIERLQTSPNKFMDISNDINVKSVDDIGFTVKGEYNIVIYYGSQVIEMNRNCFNSESYRSKLESIGVNVYTHVNEDNSILYKVTYWGETVDEYSRVE